MTVPGIVETLKLGEASATPGPWKVVNGERYMEYKIVTDAGASILYITDMQLMCAARNALPDLIKELEELRAENKKLNDWFRTVKVMDRCQIEHAKFTEKIDTWKKLTARVRDLAFVEGNRRFKEAFYFIVDCLEKWDGK